MRLARLLKDCIALSEITSELRHDALACAPITALSVSLASSTTEKEVC